MLSSTPASVEETEVDAEATAKGTHTQTRAHLEEGDKVSRYVVLREVGSGAMGVVYEAFDPELDRRIALKIIREPVAVERPDVLAAHRQKVLAEAQAMARLSHPNVVTVHDVGASEAGVFIAMEFVEGLPMHRWFRADQRSWQEVLDMCLQAGRGLQAAHEAGLVHRDFKPHNVLVGKDGVVRVGDFGLARLTSNEPAAPTTGTAESGELEAIRRRSLSTQSLSLDGKIVGTPAYMSPEQFMAGPADARSDQFSFCVTTYQGIFGHSPFGAETYAEMALAVTSGSLREEVKTGLAPPWVRRTLLRGLSVVPEDRYPDMATLLARLDYVARRRSLRTFGLVGSVGVVAAVVGVLASNGEPAASPQPCSGLDAEIREVWNPEVQAELSDHFEQSGAVFAKTTFDSIRLQFDEYAEAWGAARTEACEATRVAGDQSEELMDRRVYCLSLRKAALGEAVELLGDADRGRIARAQQLAEGLPAIDACSRDELTERGVLERDLPSEDGARRAIEALDSDILRGELLGKAGDYDGATSILRASVKTSVSLERTERTAWAQQALGLVLYQAGEWAESEQALSAALIAAEESAFDEKRLETLSALISTLGELERPREANRLGDIALALHRRIGGTWRTEARIHVSLGTTDYNEIRYAEAREHYERALSLAEGQGPNSVSAAAHNNLGLLLRDVGEYERALEEFAAGGDYYRVRYGDKHPGVGHARVNAGTTYDLVGDADRAIRELEEVIELFIEIEGEDSVDVALASDALGIVLDETGRSEEALPHHQRAVDILSGRVGSEAELALALDNKGLVLLELGEPEQAREALELSLETWTKAVGKTHPDIAYPLTDLARAEQELGNRGRAVSLLRQALGLVEDSELAVTQVDGIRFRLARAVSDRKEARELAEACLESIDAWPEHLQDSRREQVQGFLDSL